jgi:hypothetical protein
MTGSAHTVDRRHIGTAVPFPLSAACYLTAAFSRPNRRSLSKLVVIGGKIAHQDGRVRVSHCEGQSTHLRRAVAPMLRIVGVARGHGNRTLPIIMEPDGTFARALSRFAFNGFRYITMFTIRSPQVSRCPPETSRRPGLSRIVTTRASSCGTRTGTRSRMSIMNLSQDAEPPHGGRR